jgi:hypothetical protein
MSDHDLPDDADIATGCSHCRRQNASKWLPVPGIRIEGESGVTVETELHERRQLVPGDMKRVAMRPVLYRNLVEVCLRVGRPDLAEDR